MKHRSKIVQAFVVTNADMDNCPDNVSIQCTALWVSVGWHWTFMFTTHSRVDGDSVICCFLSTPNLLATTLIYPLLFSFTDLVGPSDGVFKHLYSIPLNVICSEAILWAHNRGDGKFKKEPCHYSRVSASAEAAEVGSGDFTLLGSHASLCLHKG